MKIIYKILICLTILVSIFFSFEININIEAAVINEDKIYSNATINNKFSPDSVLVLLNEEASCSDKVYNIDDFDNVKCSDVTDLTKDKFEKLKSLNKNVNGSNFKRLLCLELEDSSKEYVLDVIDELMKRDDVL